MQSNDFGSCKWGMLQASQVKGWLRAQVRISLCFEELWDYGWVVQNGEIKREFEWIMQFLFRPSI